jgi:hypothetical protein
MKKNYLCQAQKDSLRKKIEIGVSCGYGIPASGGDFGRYYKGSVLPELTAGYCFNYLYAVQIGANYSLFSVKSLDQDVSNNQYRMLVNNPPYTDLVGGGIRTIGIFARAKRTFVLNPKLNFNLLAGPCFVFLEKSPVDATDGDGVYQILEHYIHEKTFGLNAGLSLAYKANETILFQASLDYNLYLTSFVTDQSMGLLSPKIGLLLLL